MLVNIGITVGGLVKAVRVISEVASFVMMGASGANIVKAITAFEIDHRISEDEKVRAKRHITEGDLARQRQINDLLDEEIEVVTYMLNTAKDFIEKSEVIEDASVQGRKTVVDNNDPLLGVMILGKRKLSGSQRRALYKGWEYADNLHDQAIACKTAASQLIVGVMHMNKEYNLMIQTIRERGNLIGVFERLYGERNLDCSHVTLYNIEDIKKEIEEAMEDE